MNRVKAIYFAINRILSTSEMETNRIRDGVKECSEIPNGNVHINIWNY